MFGYCLKTFDIDILKILISGGNSFNGNNNTQLVKKPTKEFILLYCSQNLFESETFEDKIIKTIMDIETKEEFESLVNEINEMKTDSSISIISSLKWNSIYSYWKTNEKVLIKCKQDVDWILDNFESDKFIINIFMSHEFKEIIQIESWELVEYTINKFNGNLNFSSNQPSQRYYKYSLNKAINENNNGVLDSFIQNSGDQVNIPKLLIHSIKENSFDIVEFILGFYQIQLDYNKFDIEWINLKDINTFDSFFTVARFTRKLKLIDNNSNPDTIIKCITILINQFNGNGNNGNGKKETKIIQDVISCLYRKLVQSSLTTIDKIYNCNAIINSKTQFKIEHTNYHSFCYLGIKSIKFQKYLMELPLLNEKFIEKFIDCSILTKEFIFQCSFDEILDNLMNQTLFVPSTNTEFVNDNEKFYRKSLNYNLLYLLEIKRGDLFFNLLNKIENQLQDPTFTFGQFPDTLSNNQDSHIFTTFSKCNSNYCNCNSLPPIVNNRVFKLSKKVTFASLILFNNDDGDFQKFISFSSYYSIIKTFYKLTGSNKKILKSNHHEIITHFYYHHFRPTFQCYHDTSIGNFFWNKIDNKYSSIEMVHLDKQLLNLINNYSFINGNIDKDLLESIKSTTNNRIGSLNNLILTKLN